jgi:hypothetical protein
MQRHCNWRNDTYFVQGIGLTLASALKKNGDETIINISPTAVFKNSCAEQSNDNRTCTECSECAE